MSTQPVSRARVITGCGEQVTPARVDGLHGAEVVALAAGKFHSAALARDGTLFTWGFGRGGRLGAAAPPVVRARVEAVPKPWLGPGKEARWHAGAAGRASLLGQPAPCPPRAAGAAASATGMRQL